MGSPSATIQIVRFTGGTCCCTRFARSADRYHRLLRGHPSGVRGAGAGIGGVGAREGVAVRLAGDGVERVNG